MSRAVVRAMQVLELLGQSEDGLTHAQISKSLNIPKSSVTAILVDLASGEFIFFDQSTKKYILGSKIVSLAHNYLQGLDLIKVGEPIVKDLAKATGESVAIYVQSGQKAQLIYKQDSPQSVSRLLKVGARAPMYAIAAGKVLLAYMSEEKINTFLSTIAMKPITPYTITDAKKLRKELDTIRTGALAYNRQEFEEGVVAVAAPVRDRYGKVVAALTVVAPSFRIDEKMQRDTDKVLAEAAIYFSKMMGFQKI